MNATAKSGWWNEDRPFIPKKEEPRRFHVGDVVYNSLTEDYDKIDQKRPEYGEMYYRLSDGSIVHWSKLF